MRPIDIYNSKVISTDDIYDLEEYISNEIMGLYIDHEKIEESRKIEVKKHFFHNIDGERTVSLSSVWFEGNPVMITQGAGRGERDHNARFITNEDLYVKMIEFIRSFNTEELYGLCNETDEIPELTNFYGWSVENEILVYNE